MNRKLYTGIGMGLAAAASLAMLTWPTKNRRVRRTVKALSKVADDLSGALSAMKIF